MKENPIICAIDTPDVSKAIKLSNEIKNNVGAIKLGLEFFCKNGPNGIIQVAKTGIPIFLDLKLHDIPNTVVKGLDSISSLPCFMTTIHMLNGKETIKKCVEFRNNNPKSPMVFGVTILTSHDNIKEIGINHKIEEEVLLLAKIAVDEGLDGLVCSPHEIAPIRKEFGDKIKLLCPGIRPEGSNVDDQKRIMTPKQAIELGADYLVIGRPITESSQPEKISQEILNTID